MVQRCEHDNRGLNNASFDVIMHSRHCMVYSCTLVRIAVELLRVRFVHSGVRARTPAGRYPFGWVAFRRGIKGSVVCVMPLKFHLVTTQTSR